MMFSRLSILFLLIGSGLIIYALTGYSQANSPNFYLLLTTGFLQGLAIVFVLLAQKYSMQKTLSAKEQELLQEHSKLTQYREQIQHEIEAETSRLDQQARKISDRYCLIHEWLDSPELIDLGAKNSQGLPLAASGTSQINELAEKDLLVTKILETSAEKIYEKVRNNSYAPHGSFDIKLFRDDLIEIAEEIAHVYQPNLENPLLQTSPEQLARAINRIGLHLLAVLDQLPLDLKSYNIQQTYDVIRTAIKAYGTYKKAAPYLDWATKGAYFGRVLASTNPLTIGLMWGATELGKMGAKKLAASFVDRQAIGLMQSLVRVVGHEVASIYSEGFRYRDPNWCYAVELSHLGPTFPESREQLKYVFEEAGRIQLRNEYDRLSLYRSLVSGKPLRRNSTHPELLEETQRREIIELLETAYHGVLHGKTTPQADRWRQEVQEHLGLQFSVKEKRESYVQTADAARQVFSCLIAFLEQIKDYEEEKLSDRIKRVWNSEAWKELDAGLGEEELLSLVSDRNLLEIAPPDLSPDSPLVQFLLSTLAELYVESPPNSVEVERLILQMGLYYRHDEEATYQKIISSFQSHAIKQLRESASILKQATPEQCKAIMFHRSDLFPSGNHLVSLFPSVVLQSFQAESGNSLFLVQTTTRLFLLSTGTFSDAPEILWESDSSTTLKNSSGVLTASALLTGGKERRTSEEQASRVPIEISIQAPMTTRFQSYFESLIRFFGDSRARKINQ